MATFLNATPHSIKTNAGAEYAPCGTIARVSAIFTEADADGICSQQFGSIIDLPAQQEGQFIIVSALVLAAAKEQFPERTDLVAPATGHKDCVRVDGRIVSVPCFVR